MGVAAPRVPSRVRHGFGEGRCPVRPRAGVLAEPCSFSVFERAVAVQLRSGPRASAEGVPGAARQVTMRPSGGRAQGEGLVGDGEFPDGGVADHLFRLVDSHCVPRPPGAELGAVGGELSILAPACLLLDHVICRPAASPPGASAGMRAAVIRLPTGSG